MSTTNKIKLIELNYHCHHELNSPEQVINKHLPSNLFVDYLKDFADTCLVKHLDFEGEEERNGIHYKFFRRNNRFTQIPLKTHQFIKQQKPDMILVQGFVFPVQLLFLRRAVGKQPIIVLQHHGEQPAGKKLQFQKIADRFVDGYIFSSIGNAEAWIKARVIRDRSKCFEMPSSSTVFSKLDKNDCRQRLGLQDGINFLWVGRLNQNKDPLTVLKAFEKYAQAQSGAWLWMLYSEDDMINEIRNFVEESQTLKERVRLIGKRPHEELQTWYSASDYFISASHREGGSYAVTEAMACGCIPIVTNIPASMNAIDDGKAGIYFEAADWECLLKALEGLDQNKLKEMSARVIDRFKKHLSAESIADRLKNIYKTLKAPFTT